MTKCDSLDKFREESGSLFKEKDVIKTKNVSL